MFKQIVAVTSINLRSIRSRAGMSLVIMISVAAVVGVLLSLLALRVGLEQAISGVASPARAVIVDTNSGANPASVTLSQVPTIADLPGVAHDARGNALINTFASAPVDATRKGSGDLANIQILGINSVMPEVVPQFHLIAGRMFRPAVRELIVGKLAQIQYVGMNIGDRIHTRGVDWLIVGSFEEGGSTDEGGLDGDVNTVMSEMKQPNYAEVQVQLQSAGDFPRFEKALTANPSLQLDAKSEPQFNQDELGSFYKLIDRIGYFVAGIMAVGAISAALNAMYAAVEQRKMEIATLRAIGFGGAAVAISVVIETLLVALPGACLGALIAYLCYNNSLAETYGMIFHMAITPGLVGLAFIWTVVISLVGGLPPAIAAARVPVAVALRAS